MTEGTPKGFLMGHVLMDWLFSTFSYLPPRSPMPLMREGWVGNGHLIHLWSFLFHWNNIKCEKFNKVAGISQAHQDTYSCICEDSFPGESWLTEAFFCINVIFFRGSQVVLVLFSLSAWRGKFLQLILQVTGPKVETFWEAVVFIARLAASISIAFRHPSSS